MSTGACACISPSILIYYGMYTQYMHIILICDIAILHNGACTYIYMYVCLHYVYNTWINHIYIYDVL